MSLLTLTGRLALLGALAAVCVFDARGADCTEGRDWTVQDSIAVRYFATNSKTPGILEGFVAKDWIEWSPGKKHFFILAHHGNLSCDCTTYELMIFSAADLKRWLAQAKRSEPADAARRVKFSAARSEASFQGINEARWENEQNILFFGVNGKGPQQVYRLNVESGALKPLTASDRDVISYSTVGDSILYTTFTRSSQTPLDTYPMVAIKADELAALSGEPGGTLELLASRHGGTPRSVAVGATTQNEPWISPDGNKALISVSPVGFVPPERWSKYQINTRGHFRDIGRFMLIDLADGQLTPLFDAPTGKATQAGWYSPPEVLWSPYSDRAILINTALPLDSDSTERSKTPFIVEWDVAKRRWTLIDSLLPIGGNDDEATRTIRMATDAKWLRAGEQFSLRRTTYQGSTVADVTTTLYTRRGAQWRKAIARPSADTAAANLATPLIVRIRQTANDPPMPVASDGAREITLVEPDPALSGIWRAAVREVQWPEEGGRTGKGGLLLPRDFSNNHPVPLVIQAYAYVPEQFLPDGTSMTAYAAQPLVAAGMAVLFIAIPKADPDLGWSASVGGTVREGQVFVKRLDAAVARLSEEGLIDRNKVGLIGFSRAGFNTAYAITHPGAVSLGAALIADSWTASYGEYVLDAATSVPGQAGGAEGERYYGGGTFWQNKAAWLEHSPSFNVDRVATPTLFAKNGKSSNLFWLEMPGAFRITKRPFEYLSFRDGDHQLQRPKERLASLTASVDWMAFWLQGKEDPDEEKVEQYERWRKIQSDWQRQRATAGLGSPPSFSKQ